MPGNKAELGEQLERNVGRLLGRVNDLTVERDELRLQLQRQKQLTERVRADAAKTRRELEASHLANAIAAAGPEASQEARKRVNQLVREIDQCIALLKQG